MSWSKEKVSSFLLLYSTLVWFYLVQSLIDNLLSGFTPVSRPALTVWAIFYSTLAVSSIFGGLFAEVLRKTLFLKVWIIISSLMVFLALGGNADKFTLHLLALLWGMMGIGFPITLTYFSNVNNLHERANAAGLIILSSFLTLPGILILIHPLNLFSKVVILTLWRIWGICICYFIDENRLSLSNLSFSFHQAALKKDFLLYFIPWILLGFVNQAEQQLYLRFFEARFVSILIFSTFLITGASTFVTGYLVDRIGRKHLIIGGFAALGLGYAMLSFVSTELLALTIFLIFDSAAFGIFFTLFVLILWGDLSENGGREATYALGITPPFLGLAFAPFTSSILSILPLSSAFSIGALFLFLALIPLVYAPETLPRDIVERRKVRNYIEKAKRLKEKEGSERTLTFN